MTPGTDMIMGFRASEVYGLLTSLGKLNLTPEQAASILEGNGQAVIHDLTAKLGQSLGTISRIKHALTLGGFK